MAAPVATSLTVPTSAPAAPHFDRSRLTRLIRLLHTEPRPPPPHQQSVKYPARDSYLHWRDRCRGESPPRSAQTSPAFHLPSHSNARRPRPHDPPPRPPPSRCIV